MADTTQPTVAIRTTPVLGTKFFTGSLGEACDVAARGGLLTAPSGPGLGFDLVRSSAYRRALEASDIVLTDSAFMVILWRMRTGTRLPRNSGLAFLRIWLNRDIMRQDSATFWVMPNAEEAQRTRGWLRAQGYPASEEDFYVAPMYQAGPIVDAALRDRIDQRRPKVIYVGIGGGVQERLGHYLRDNLSYRPVILCLGAAMAFVTGAQVKIPVWVDRWGLGWLWRVVSDPSRFAQRYLRATSLFWLIFRFGENAPPFARSARPEAAKLS